MTLASTSKLATLVFIDASVQDYQSLVNGVCSNANVMILNPSRDGVIQITETIARCQRVESIHIISHGEPGKLSLGASELSLATLSHYARHLRSWGQSFTNDAEILIYGCKVAAGAVGACFVQHFSRLTGAAIAASANLTGNMALGGDWMLEISTRPIKSPLVFDRDTIANYPFTFAPDAIPNLIYTISGDKVYVTSIKTGASTEPYHLGTGALTPNTLAFSTDANARDHLSADNLLYYVANDDVDTKFLNHLGTWNPVTGEKADLGLIAGATLTNSPRMAFRGNGQLYIMTGSNLYSVSTGTGLGTGNTEPVGKVTGTMTISGLSGGGGDIAFDPLDPNLLYIAGTGTNSLYKVTFTGSTPSAAVLVGAMGGGSPGLAFGPDGNLYSGDSNNLYRVNTTNGSRTSIGALGKNANDMATLPVPSPDLDLSVTITDSNTSTTSGNSVTYTITVTNTSGFNINGISIVDKFTDPNLSGTPSWSAATAPGVTFPPGANQSGTGNINVKVNLEAGASVTYTVTGFTVSGAAGNTISNTVTVEPPEGITDNAANPGANTATDTTTIAAPPDTTAPVVTVDTLVTSDGTPQLTGTIDDLTADVIVNVNGIDYAATNNGDGTWTLTDNTIAPALTSGTYNVTATATDSVGNVGTDTTTGELIVDTIAPVITVTALTTADGTPQLTGTIDDPTADVIVNVNGVDYAATNNGDGTWTLADNTIAPALASGTYNVTATATDSVGNVGTDTTTSELIVDVTAPVVTVNTLTTADGTPQLTGTIDDPTADVIVNVNGIDYAATNNGDGTWTLADNTIAPALASGTYNIAATATDTLGNVGTDTTTGELIVDRTAPIVTVNTLTTADGTPQLTGTVDDLTATIQVTVDGKNYAATNNGDSTWTLADNTIAPALASGTYNVTATATDTLGNSGVDTTTGELIIDTIAPVVTVDILTTNDSTPQLTGTIDDPTADVIVNVNGTDYTATNNGDGTWTLADNTIAPALTSGTYNVTATATDTLGNAGTDATTGELVIDRVAPVVTVNTLTTADGTPALTGTVDDPTASVIVSVNGTDYTATNNGDGTWTLADNTIAPTLASGTYNVTATATDTLGNIGTDITTGELIVDRTAPVITIHTLTTADSTPQLTGTIDDPTAGIQVTVNGNSYTATNNGDGTWTLADDAIAPALTSGTYNVTATATDTLGNVGMDTTTGELIVDTIAPVVTVNLLTTADGTPALTGTIDDPTATVIVSVNGTDYTATNNGDGTWTLADNTIAPALASGTYNVTATATDTLGNVGTDTTMGELIVDTIAPVVTVTALTTADGTPQLTGTIDDPTAGIQVTVNGNSYTATNNGDGTWTLADNTIAPALASGTYNVIVAATDTAGNVGTDTTSNELTVDGIVPVVTITALTTADGTPQLTGTIDDPAASITVMVNGQTYAATNNGDGTWALADDTISPALTSGTYDVTVTATDTLGNVGSDTTTNELTIDTTAPVVTVNSLITNDGTPQLTGTIDDPTAAIQVTVNGQTYTATNNGNGTWTLADDTIAPALADATYDVAVTATDTIGNVGTDTTSNELVVNFLVPTVTIDSLITADRTPVLTGTVSNPTASIQVTVNGNTYSATNNGNGTWTLADDTIAPALADGIYDIVVTADDGFGNIGTDATNNELTVDATPPVVAIDPLTTSDGTPQLTGTIDDPTADVTVTVNGQTYTATNNGNGTWTLADNTIAPALLDGTYNVTATATDTVGNVGTDGTNNELVINSATFNQSPVAQDVSTRATPGNATSIQGIQATDVDGTIVSYTISTLPDATQGTLYLGNPAAGGTAITFGQTLTPDQASQLVFQAAPGFTGTRFSYTATDNSGATDATPATVTLNANQAPVAADILDSPAIAPGATAQLPALSATDPDGTIVTYTILTVPNADQGILYLGDPASGGTPITSGQRLSPDQVSQLFFKATGQFQEARFTYTTTDNSGAIDATPATILLSNRKVQVPLESVPVDEETCSIQNGLSLRDGNRKGILKGSVNRDRIMGRGGNDILRGGEGGDVISGGRGKDRLSGGGCDDLVIGNQGHDKLRGNKGRDTLRGGIGRDMLAGNDGRDFLRGGGSRDRLKGGRDNDRLKGGLHQDSLRGGQGNDLLFGNGGNDRLKGELGDDRLNGGQGNDRLNGGQGNDRLNGGQGRDRLWGKQGNDVMRGGLRQDTLWGYKGNDTLNGGYGNDILNGGNGRDFLQGKRHHDKLLGHGQADRLVGGFGKDTLNGGAGDDTLIGGFGKDVLHGGAGNDQFVYYNSKDKGDRIVNFDVNQDVIDLSRIFAKPNYPAAKPLKQYVKLNQMGANTVIQLDSNGKAAGGFQNSFITLENVTATQLRADNWLV